MGKLQICLYFSKTDITATVLYSILANWLDNKHIICNVNNDIPVKIPNHPYILVNRSVLCNCRIEVENNFLLESLAVYHDVNYKLVMYCVVHTAFVNYLDDLDNLTDSLKFPSVDAFILFTTEDARPDGSIPFLDTIVMPLSDGSLLTSVYRMPTHTDQYLQWNSHHHLSVNCSVINTSKHRAKTVCSNHHLLKEEEDHLNKALKRYM